VENQIKKTESAENRGKKKGESKEAQIGEQKNWERI